MKLSEINSLEGLRRFCSLQTYGRKQLLCDNCEILGKDLSVKNCRSPETVENILRYNRKQKLSKLLSQ